MKLVFATNNLNKLKEVQEMLPNSIELLSLKDINCFDDIEETATTLEGNAKIKANYITEKFGYNCFADDTGLEVEVINGAPGVYSARYAGEPVNSENNMVKLLNALESQTNRKAQFRTSLCLNLNGEQFLFTCTNLVGGKFLKTYMVDTDKKTIIHLNSHDLVSGDKWSQLNEPIEILSWEYPVVIGYGISDNIHIQYFNFLESFNTSSSFYKNKTKPYSQVYECIK